MTKTGNLFGLLLLSLGVVVASCTQQPASDATPNSGAEVAADAAARKVMLAPAISTVKPGASVTFSHQAVKTLEVGENGAVTITVNEGYPTGTLTLEATGGDGLEVFGATRVTEVAMSDVTTHSWRVDFQPQSAGVHYVNVLATAKPEPGVIETRAYAVRVNAGDWANAKAEAAMPTEMLSDDMPAVMLKAEETIE